MKHDEAAVTAIMGLFSDSYDEATNIYKQNRLAEQQVKDRTARRMFRPSEVYEGVPPEDLAKFALMSDKERKQHRMARAKKLEAAPPKKQHKKQVSARRKKNWEQAEKTLDSDDGMPMLTEDSVDEDSDSSARNSSLSEFDSDEEFSYRKKGNRKKPV